MSYESKKTANLFRQLGVMSILIFIKFEQNMIQEGQWDKSILPHANLLGLVIDKLANEQITDF